MMTLVYIALALLELAFIVRAILRPNRDPASRIAWVVVIIVLPGLGILAYLLFGETNIGQKRAERVRKVLADMPPPAAILAADAAHVRPDIPERFTPLFHLGETINGFSPVGGNSAELMADSNSGIDSMVADMDAATAHIHLIFYIWLNDNNGTKVVDALIRAAQRGVTCRAMVDGLGSRSMIRSQQWQQMQRSGVRLGIALKIGIPLLRLFTGRIDLRNHRKIVVIDDRITYCGSQNCADPEFRVKPGFAPWVDTLMRFEGPIARQNQHIFVGDWMTYVDEDIRDVLHSPMRAPTSGFTAQVIATGPTLRNSAMPETFAALMYAATRELTITTPYYVPNDSMQAALCAAAHRGVNTTIIFPARNDSWEVAATSRSYYSGLLEAGVKIYEFVGGLLHSKTLTLDNAVTLIGSANLDRRSFDLNFENNILLVDPTVTATLRARQAAYIAASNEVHAADIKAWSMGRRLWNNTVGMFGPLL